jgi:hypothetical protein
MGEKMTEIEKEFFEKIKSITHDIRVKLLKIRDKFTELNFLSDTYVPKKGKDLQCKLAIGSNAAEESMLLQDAIEEYKAKVEEYLHHQDILKGIDDIKSGQVEPYVFGEGKNE